LVFLEFEVVGVIVKGFVTPVEHPLSVSPGITDTHEAEVLGFGEQVYVVLDGVGVAVEEPCTLSIEGDRLLYP
jgi:hypothetical protein